MHSDLFIIYITFIQIYTLIDTIIDSIIDTIIDTIKDSNIDSNIIDRSCIVSTVQILSTSTCTRSTKACIVHLTIIRYLLVRIRHLYLLMTNTSSLDSRTDSVHSRQVENEGGLASLLRFSTRRLNCSIQSSPTWKRKLRVCENNTRQHVGWHGREEWS